MAASANDLFMEVGDPGTATTLSAPGYTAGGSSMTVGSTSNWPTATGTIFAVDEAEIVDGEEVRIEGTYNEFEGTVASGTSITNVDWVRGVGDRNYAAGALTRVYIPVSAERENRMVQGILSHADQDGTLKAGAVDIAAVLADNVVTTAKILDSNVTTAKIADSNVTTAKVLASGCDLSASAAQSIANNTAAVVRWNTEAYDTAGYHDTVTNDSRITVPTAGKYAFTATITFDANSAGSRLVWFIKNGTAAERYGYDGKNAVASPLNTPITTSVTLNLAANDYVEVYVYQSSGGALNITSDAQEIGASKFTCTRIGS